MAYFSWHDRHEVQEDRTLFVHRFTGMESGSCQVSLLQWEREYVAKSFSA